MQSKVYNPFRKAYWSKDNLLKSDEEKAANIKKFKDNQEKAKDMNNTMKKFTRFVVKLNLMTTVPVLLTVFLGILGMVLGAIIFIITLVSFFKTTK